MGIKDFDKKYDLQDMCSKDVIFAATGVTSGNLLNGVKRVGDKIHTQSLVMSSFDGVVRTVTSVTPVS